MSWTAIRNAILATILLAAVVASLFWFGLWVRQALFDTVYGDSVRDVVREMVKPEALK